MLMLNLNHLQALSNAKRPIPNHKYGLQLPICVRRSWDSRVNVPPQTTQNRKIAASCSSRVRVLPSPSEHVRVLKPNDTKRGSNDPGPKRQRDQRKDHEFSQKTHAPEPPGQRGLHLHSYQSEPGQRDLTRKYRITLRAIEIKRLPPRVHFALFTSQLVPKIITLSLKLLLKHDLLGPDRLLLSPQTVNFILELPVQMRVNHEGAVCFLHQFVKLLVLIFYLLELFVVL